MTFLSRAARRLAPLLPLALIGTAPLSAQQTGEVATVLPEPQAIQTGDEVPWIYRGSDVPRDPEWLFGEMDNGLRYATRENGVPQGQVSIRIRIDAGSLHEEESELGFAHLLEHMTFRESKYLAAGEAIPTWQRLGATFGSDTNAETSPTHTVYKLDLPNATPEALELSFRLLSGMIREPVLSQANLSADVPIVLAEKRTRGGAEQRVATKSRETLFFGQRLANRTPIGTEATLTAATPSAVQAFHDRWYRPQNAVIAVAGDVDAGRLASLVEKYFGDWEGKGDPVAAPDFGDPVAPPGIAGDRPIGEVAVIVEPDLPRSLTYAVMRPWRPVQDTVAYNQGLLRDALAQALINRRLEARARAGGSFLYAQIRQDDVSRSTDATFVSLAPLSGDWKAALNDVRGVIEDALATPPSDEELAREIAEYESVFVSQVEQRGVLPGSRLADDIVNAVDIREAVAAPETVLSVFRGMKDSITPAAILRHTRELFRGDVIRGFYVTPERSEADEGALRMALADTVQPNTGVRLAAQEISFDELAPIGEPGQIVERKPLGVFEVERIEFANGVRALLWPNTAEPGRVAVKVRFGAGYRAFERADAVYAGLGEAALVSSGQGELGQEELDRISTGRVMGFDFGIGDAVFTFAAQTRDADLADQLYLFANKLDAPRWDPNPVNRAKAAQRIAYESYATSPAGLLTRDLEYLLANRDARFKIASPDEIDSATPEGFRQVWEPLLAQGDVEVLLIGDFDLERTVEDLKNTFGALDRRDPIAPEAAARVPAFAEPRTAPLVLEHRGDANQAAAVIAWETGGGMEGLRHSRQLEILTDLFNNRLTEAMRERAGASYSPQVGTRWPVDIEGGGRISAIAQLRPEDVPVFFDAARGIAQDLATKPVEADELARVTEPLRQLVTRASTGNLFWMYQLEGASNDPRRIAALRYILPDYTQTTPEKMQALAQLYFADEPGWRLAIIPEGQELALEGRARAEQIIGR